MLSAYSSEIQPWKSVVEGKWVIFDTDAIASIMVFDRLDLMDELKGVASGFAVIHPVQLELFRTNSSKERIARMKLLNDYDFVEIPLNSRELRAAMDIQKSLPVTSQPSAVDLYLGATLINHHNDRLVLTANIKDFPMPMYPRVGHMLLQDDRKTKLFTFLSLDREQINT